MRFKLHHSFAFGWAFLLQALGAQAQGLLLVDAGGGLTQGAFIPFDEVEDQGVATGRLGYSYRAGVLGLVHGYSTSFCTGIRFSRSVYRQHVAYQHDEGWTPSFFKRVEHAYDGIATAERLAITVPL